MKTPYKVLNNEILLHFGSKMSVFKESKNGRTGRMDLIEGNEINLFVCLFDEEDVDFYFEFDTTLSNRGMLTNLSIAKDDRETGYTTQSRTVMTLRTLRCVGKKFHFKSQTTDEGKQMVVDYAREHNTSYAEAERIVSRIIFAIRYEDISPKVSNTMIDTEVHNTSNTVDLEGKRIQLLVKIPNENCIVIQIGCENTVQELKELINRKVKIPVIEQRIIFGTKQLESCKKIGDYDLTDGSLVFLAFYLSGAGVARNPDSPQYKSLENTELGVVCYGEDSDQTFVTDPDFVAEKTNYSPLTIEFRYKPKRNHL